MSKLTAADLMVIVDTLNHSLQFKNWGLNGGGFTTETRKQTMEVVVDIMADMSLEVVYGAVEPVVIDGDIGG
jgi:hypothetical protein